MWVLIGAAAGWGSYAKLGMNEQRGVLVAIAIGAAGGFFGGHFLSPFFVGPPPADPGFLPIVLSAGAAVALLALGNHLEKRWGV